MRKLGPEYELRLEDAGERRVLRARLADAAPLRVTLTFPTEGDGLDLFKARLTGGRGRP